MGKFNFKKIWIIMLLVFSIFFFQIDTNAADWEISWYNIIPELSSQDIQDVDTAIQQIWQTAWEVMDSYTTTAESWADQPAKQIASWIMTRDTILDYLQYVVRFLSELWIVVWVGFIIYAWYKYMTSIFAWMTPPTKTLKNAIIWIIIIIFSYAILKTLTSLVWIS